MPTVKNGQNNYESILASSSKKIVVIAGPGSGKTNGILIPKTRHLLGQISIDGDRVLLLTFSRLAALDLKKKVKSDVVEKMFSEIEKHASKIIKKINAGEHSLSAQEKADLAMFLAAMYFRTPHSIDKSHEMSRQMTQEFMKRAAMYEPQFEKGMKAIQKNTVIN